MRIFPSTLYSQDHEIERVSVIVPTYYYFHAGTRAFFEKVLQEMPGSTEQGVFRFLMVVDELVTNAIEYGSKVGDEVAVTLYFYKKKWVEVVVEDAGTGKEQKTAIEMQAFLEKKKQEEKDGMLALRGRGLARIAVAWTDEINFSDREGGGLLVRARKYVV